MIHDLLETNIDFCECLSTLFAISPSLVVEDDNRDANIIRLRDDSGDYCNDLLKSSSSCVIAITGNSGVGKRLRARALFHRLRESSLYAVLFSFDDTDVRRSSVAALLSSVIFQVLNQDPQRFSRIRNFFLAMKETMIWSTYGLLQLLRSVLDTRTVRNPLYLVIDGLHRCDSSWQDLLDALLVVFNNEASSVELKVAIFYQDRQNIREVLKKFSKHARAIYTLTRDTMKPYMGAIAGMHIEALAINGNTCLGSLKPQILEAMGKCNTIKELSLALQSLSNTRRARRHTRKSLQSLIENVPLSASKLVAARFGALPGWARSALGWIVFAKRPLKLNELEIATTITDHKSKLVRSFDLQSLPVFMAEDLSSVFGSLLRVEYYGIVFTNSEVRDEFSRLVALEARLERKYRPEHEADEERGSLEFTVPREAEITEILLEYLCWTHVAGPINNALAEDYYIKPQGRLFDLVSYAADFWPMHYRAAEKIRSHKRKVFDLVRSNDLFHTWPKLYSRLNSEAPLAETYETRELQLAARLGLTGIVKDPQTGGDRNFAICQAMWGDYADIVDILLRNTEDMDDDRDLSEALENAAYFGSDHIITRLLTHLKATGNLRPKRFDRLICQMARLGYEHYILRFREFGTGVNAVVGGMMPLQHATYGGHASVVHSLLEEGAEVDSEAGDQGEAPIVIAAEQGFEAIVKDLLAFHANPLSGWQDPVGRTPLYVASHNGHERVVKLLLARIEALKTERSKPESNAANSVVIDQGDGTSFLNDRRLLGKPLIAACTQGHAAIQKLLISYGADVTLLDDDEHTVLYRAITCGDESLVKAILDASIPMNQFGDIKDVILSAARHGFTDIIDRYQKSGIQVNGSSLWDIEGSDGLTPLHCAARGGQLGIISLLLEANVDIDIMDDEGNSPLALAAVTGKIETVRELFDRKASALVRNERGENLLVQIAKNPSPPSIQVNIVDILLANGVDPNGIDDLRRTALHWAAEKANVDMVRILLKHPATDIHCKARWEWNALHCAANDRSSKAREVAELLIERGLDPLEPETEGWVPMHIASKVGNVGMLGLLSVQHKISLEVRAMDGSTALHFATSEPKSLNWLLDHGANIDSADESGVTALMKASSEASLQSVETLLRLGANPSLRDCWKRNALHHAALLGEVTIGRKLLEEDKTLISDRDEENRSPLHLAILDFEPEFAEMLLDFLSIEPGLDDLNAVESDQSRTILMSAVSTGHSKVTGKLLKLGADIQARDKNGDTALLIAIHRGKMTIIHLLLDHAALYEAARRGFLEVVKKLVGSGAKVDAEGGAYNTALTVAAVGGFDDVVKYLLEEGADAKVGGGNFPNALSAVLYSETFYLVDQLLAKGAEINATDSQGRTCLHIAAQHSVWEWIEDLGRKGGDLTARDKQGRTLLHHAAMSSKPEVVLKIFEDEQLSSKLNIKDVDGWEPMHWACRRDQNSDIVAALAESQSDLQKPTKDGWTPEIIAVYHGADGVIDYIRETIEQDNDAVSQTATTDAVSVRKKEWKAGTYHRGIECDGCFLLVSLIR